MPTYTWQLVRDRRFCGRVRVRLKYIEAEDVATLSAKDSGIPSTSAVPRQRVDVVPALMGDGITFDPCLLAGTIAWAARIRRSLLVSVSP
ncbi:hypothetical protein ACLBWP_16555 [Microbacterium sp. M1A1_1b]